MPWLSIFLTFEVLPNLGWALLTPLIVYCGRRVPFRRSRFGRTLAIHLALALGVGLLYSSVYAFLGTGEGMRPVLLSPEVAARIWPSQVARTLSGHVVMYGVILGAGGALDLWTRRREEEREQAALMLRASQLERDLADARLAALQSQLHPHALFNTLHAISAMIDWRPDDARQMLADVSDLLRHTLAQSEETTTRLDDDIDWIEQFLDLQERRFGDRLFVSVYLDPSAHAAMVPTLLLQPLVENALMHGVSAVSRTCHVQVRVERDGEQVRLVVEDDGAGLAPDRRDGLGLRNTRARLQALYGDDARLRVEARPGGGTRSLITTPYIPVPSTLSHDEKPPEVLPA
ncbi:MAG: histidine kinase [Bacteroidota bacterium]